MLAVLEISGCPRQLKFLLGNQFLGKIKGQLPEIVLHLPFGQPGFFPNFEHWVLAFLSKKPSIWSIIWATLYRQQIFCKPWNSKINCCELYAWPHPPSPCGPCAKDFEELLTYNCKKIFGGTLFLIKFVVVFSCKNIKGGGIEVV